MTPGTKLGPYEILSAIGAGGMGEVYRARDTKLGRDVAIKVLPEAFARDAERMARFQREAKVLASLNHPNIATIHGLEDSGGTHALVMELVEGPTLADRIKAGPIPVDEAVRIAKQIADALEYAHERGIIHRDLKPANVKVTNDDAVKVLDFGLAKALESDPSSIDISTSPTMSRMATMQGVLLGTAAYMSPEQAKAKSVDRRADIWAFGCVLYEMLTGRQTFTGETVTDTLASVIMRNPDLSELPVATPVRVRVLLERCLQKDPKQRLRDIGDARISLDEVLSGIPEPAQSLAAIGHPVKRRWLWVVAAFAGVLILAGAAGFAGWTLKPEPARRVTRAVINLPPGQRLAGLVQPALAISADGGELAYVAITQDGSAQQIYVRAMDSGETRPVRGTEGATNPFFSPDGQWLGFFADGKLKKIPVSGGVAQTLVEVVNVDGATWGNQGTIIFAPLNSALKQVPDGGGNSQTVTHLGKGENFQGWPEFLPNGRAVIFADAPGTGNWTAARIAAQSVGSSEHRTLVQGATAPGYAPSGHLIYAQGGSLMAVPFDARRLEVRGSAVPAIEGVLQSPVTGSAQYSISATGSLVYVPGSVQGEQSKLVWVNRNGTEQALAAPPRAYLNPRLSPDGQRAAVSISEQEAQIWLYDLPRETLTRFTFEGTSNQYPVWTPDGKRIAFRSNKEGPLNIYWQIADGSGGLERLSAADETQTPNSWSPDGQLLAFMDVVTTPGHNIWVLRMADRKAGATQRNSVRRSSRVFTRWTLAGIHLG
jgi:serine/threonine-protein kinase